MSHNPLYTCRICKFFLEEGNFNYVLDKRDGTTFLLCHDCKEDLDETATGELSEEEFKKSIKRRWSEGMKKAAKAAIEAFKKGFNLESVWADSSVELTCDQLVSWFNDLEKTKQSPQRSDFLIILNDLEKKGKLCPNCLKFRNELQEKLTKQKNELA
jgi:hypothetical protein